MNDAAMNDKTTTNGTRAPVPDEPDPKDVKLNHEYFQSLQHPDPLVREVERPGRP